MEITLRKASALQNAINDAVKSIDVKDSIRINEFQDAGVEINKAEQLFHTNVARRVALTDVLYKVRKAVSRANAAAGVNEKLADVAHLEKEIQFFSNLATREVRDELSVLEGKLNKIRNRKDESRSSLYGISDDVSTSILTQKTVSEFRSKVAEAKKAKQKLQDELLELNVRTTITLDSASVDVLRFEDLV
jgi:hypothetical protein